MKNFDLWDDGIAWILALIGLAAYGWGSICEDINHSLTKDRRKSENDR